MFLLVFLGAVGSQLSGTNSNKMREEGRGVPVALAGEEKLQTKRLLLMALDTLHMCVRSLLKRQRPCWEVGKRAKVKVNRPMDVLGGLSLPEAKRCRAGD